MAIGFFKAYILAIVGMTLSNMAEDLAPGCHGLATADARIPGVNEPRAHDAIPPRGHNDRMERTPGEEQQHLFTSETPMDEDEDESESDGTRRAKPRCRTSAKKKPDEEDSQWALLLRDICLMLHELSRALCPLIPSKPVVWAMGILYLIYRAPEALNLFFSNLAVLVVERRLLFDLEGRYLGLKQAHRRTLDIRALEMKMESVEKEAAESKERVKVLELKLDRLYERDVHSKAAFSEL